MSILGNSQIMKEIKAGRIQIDPFDERLVGPASIDLRLSNAFRVFVRLPTAVTVDNGTDFKCYTKGLWLQNDEQIVLNPGETLLGITHEKITLPDDICGWLEGRSRFARMGLLVHISASFMQAGISNHQVLEMSNFGHMPLNVYPMTPICQFVFQRMEGTGHYSGVFEGQTPETFWKG